MEQYYKSYYLRSFNKVDINFVKETQFGIKVFTCPKSGIKIGEVINDKMEISLVIYYSNLNSDIIYRFHKENYDENMLMGICEELLNGIKIRFFKKNEIIKYSINTYYDNGQPKLRQEFNKGFELVEYCQSIYGIERNLIQEKIFYADSWTIHTEKVI